MKKAILILALFPSLTWAAAYNTHQTGNWSASSTWTTGACGASTGAAVPGIGDTVNICTGHVITADTNETFGSSPNNTTTYVLQTAGTGYLSIAPGVTVTVNGNAYFNSGSSGSPVYGLQMKGGSKFVTNNSSSGGTPIYQVKFGLYSGLSTSGTSSGSQATIMATSGQEAQVGAVGSYGGAINADYLNFVNMGDATNYANGSNGMYAYSLGVANLRCYHCSSSNSGVFMLGAHDAGTTIDIRNWSATGSLGAYSLYIKGFGGTTGNYLLNSALDNAVLFNPGAGFTVQFNYISGGSTTVWPISVATGSVTNVNQSFTLFDSNFLRYPSLYSVVPIEGNLTNNYWLIDHNQANPGLLQWQAAVQSMIFSGNVIDYTGQKNVGDLIQPYNLVGTTLTHTVKHNVYLCGSDGNVVGKMISTWTNCKYTNLTFDHNTACTDGYSAESAVIGTGESGGTVNERVGEIAAYTNNLVYSLPAILGSTGGGYYMNRENSVVQDYAYANTINYNWGWNLATTTSGTCNPVPWTGFCTESGYASPGMFSAPPPNATGGGSGDPGFVDETRNLATFDTAYLGNAAGYTQWTSGLGVLSLGSFVKDSSSTFYFSSVIGYRCIYATGCDTSAANSEPGVGSAWHTYWELSSLYRLRSDTTLIPTLLTWVQAGFAPHNGGLHNTASDGTDIGAVAWVSGSVPVHQAVIF